MKLFYISLAALALVSCSHVPFEQRMAAADLITFIANTIFDTSPQQRSNQTSYSFTIDGKDYYPDDSGYVVLPVMSYDGK